MFYRYKEGSSGEARAKAGMTLTAIKKQLAAMDPKERAAKRRELTARGLLGQEPDEQHKARAAAQKRKQERKRQH
jgi:hypothetical protein